MTYNPFKYWNNRENPTPSDLPTDIEKEFLCPLIDQNRDILDVGPGVGRMFDLYSLDNRLYGIDISERYQFKAKNKAAHLGLNYQHEVINYYAYGMPFKDNLFDLVIAVKVLLHVRPDAIEYLMCEMGRVARTVAITTKIGDDPAGHVFDHDYRQIIESNNLVIISEQEIGNQLHLSYALNN